MRIADLEFRRTPAEIVSWQGAFCYVIALWSEHKEGWDLRFIGQRPFGPEIDREVFWKVAQYGQKVLDAEWEATRE